MAIAKELLKKELLAASAKAIQAGKDGKSPEEVQQTYAEEQATAFEKFVLSAIIITQPGQAVQVAFPAGTGSTVQPGEAKISLP